MDLTTLYGLPVSEFKTVEELRILAHWALTKYHKELMYG